jgi:lipoyl(octanoyl) transferase
VKLAVVRLGLTDYQAALELQLKIHKLRQREAIGDVLLLLEHHPVLTLGVNGKNANILVSDAFLSAGGVKVYRSHRGGDVTYHGPGQVVGYPILNLNYHGKSVKGYVGRLEEAFIRLLRQEYGLEAGRIPRYTGVWIGNEKIVAIGCAVRQWVTMHGFAFNVNTNLEHFQWINPCGIKDKGVTSLQKLLGGPQDLEVALARIVEHFTAVFRLEPELADQETFQRKLEELSDGE